MITQIPSLELNRLKEKRFDEISLGFLENFESGSYDEENEGEIPICTKTAISAVQMGNLPAVLDQGGYRIITVPFEGFGHLCDGPTVAQAFRIAYPASVVEKAIPAAFPASLWLNEALDLEKLGRRDRALDIIFREIDKLFRKKNFDACNRLLEFLDVDHMSPNLLVAFLTITLSAREYLPARAGFYLRAEKRLADYPNKIKLLSGLKGTPQYGPHFD